MARKKGPDLSQILYLLKSIKEISDEIEWNEKPTNSGYLEGVVILYDQSGKSIPGLTLRCEVKKAINIDEIGYKFFLHQSHDRNNFRIFSLEVCGHNIISHRDKRKRETIYGPHYHIGCKQYLGNDAIVRQVKLLLKTDEFGRWLKRFLRHANTKNGYDVPFPLEFDLFGNAVTV
ncbi:hypothetical protein [Neptuniibacter sp.]|uniref:hypothetical protein n=1 Tax=Neptuniibacter sp. TaxID=1962643 RepID=UPI0026200705|nr:hypothetical protein [Neptuniibacter sp.]MCP4597509.1 hypothetical protein [Neptuniibacter sp.]